MKQLIDFLFRPFRENLETTVVLTILSGAADCFFWTCHAIEDPNVSIFFGIYMLMHSFVLAYVIVLLAGLLNGQSLKIIKWCLYVLGFVNLCIDTGVHLIMKCGFIQDFVAIIMGTNVGETREFIGMYLNGTMILFAISVLIIIGLICHLLHIIGNRPKWLAVSGVLAVVLFSSILAIRQSHNWDGVFLMKIKTCLSYKPAPDLRPYRKNYSFIKKDESPRNIVLIIGESLNKSHMSLFGYDKKTTPILDSKSQNGHLYCYDNVLSSAIGTISSFKCLMTSATASDQDDIINKIYLADIIRSAGYNTTWISNQSSSGIHDNVVARFAELSDTTIWCGTKFTGITKSDLDGNVLEPLQQISEIDNGYSFTVVHLMGSHENFSSRFSAEYTRFSPMDYSQYPANQRQTLADYDNSILYNDWVVSSIIDLYQDKEAVIIYCPDHSLDVFDSSADYAGHARSGDSRSVQAGKNIPFIVYTTEEYRRNHPAMVDRMGKSTHNPFETENLMYTIMDVMGVDFTDGEPCVSKYSLFRNVE